ncbi:hypothetical protein LH612_30135, partial [Klebsiella pneumoniae]|nr:hypothetical protein [Klebsiella pneumoniae]
MSRPLRCTSGGSTSLPQQWATRARAGETGHGHHQRVQVCATGCRGTPGKPVLRRWEVDVKALTWHGPRDVRVEQVPDPKLEADTDA